jgi:GNAT superfamily N-acetyltransferase
VPDQNPNAEYFEMQSLEIIEANLSRTDHQDAVLKLTDAYAMDAMGNGKSFSIEVRRALIPGLQRHPTTIIFLGYDGVTPIGIATCFLRFSTFNARPVINIHDLAVLPEYRGQGVGRRLLQAVEDKARQANCCKLTLEVQENDHTARRTYETFGFGQAVHQEAAGGALFLAKAL